MSDGYPAKGIEAHNSKVFGTFICGGGSSMGYKLAGYHHLGGVELDPSIAEIYRLNHHPEYLYIEDIRDFNKRTDLPKELYELDILDGSPPCSTFSSAGSRENAWGKEKKFAEGQKMQRLDDLVFVYCDTIEKLMPKVCWLENVSGIIKGNSKVYAKEIVKRITEIGYQVQVFSLNGATMGLPQMRERVFFIGLRNDFHLPKLKLNFNEPIIPFREIDEGNTPVENKITPCDLPYYRKCKQGESISKYHPRGSRFNSLKLRMDAPTFTIAASQNTIYHPIYERALNNTEVMKACSFPIDYKAPEKKIQFLCGMSVAPIMSAQIAYEIYKQWLSKLK